MLPKRYQALYAVILELTPDDLEQVSNIKLTSMMIALRNRYSQLIKVRYIHHGQLQEDLEKQILLVRPSTGLELFRHHHIA